jgi:hypothetical protein
MRSMWLTIRSSHAPRVSIATRKQCTRQNVHLGRTETRLMESLSKIALPAPPGTTALKDQLIQLGVQVQQTVRRALSTTRLAKEGTTVIKKITTNKHCAQWTTTALGELNIPFHVPEDPYAMKVASFHFFVQPENMSSRESMAWSTPARSVTQELTLQSRILLAWPACRGIYAMEARIASTLRVSPSIMEKFAQRVSTVRQVHLRQLHAQLAPIIPI